MSDRNIRSRKQAEIQIWQLENWVLDRKEVATQKLLKFNANRYYL